MSIRGCPFFIHGHLFRVRRRPRVRDSIVSGRSSDSRIVLPAAPSRRSAIVSGVYAAFVPDYSGGPVPDFHGVPLQALYEHLSELAHSYTARGFCQAIFRFSSYPPESSAGTVYIKKKGRPAGSQQALFHEGCPACFRQMISLLLPDRVCDSVTRANSFLYGEMPCLRNSRASLGPMDSMRM